MPAPALLSIAPPERNIAELTPEKLEQFIIGGIHQDRSPGTVLVVLHPMKRFKLPEALFDSLTAHGFAVEIVETQIDEMESVRGIRDKLRELAAADPEPFDVIVVGGDGTLDHHFLLGAFAAFYPDHVSERPGAIEVGDVPQEAWDRLPASWQRTLRLGPDEVPPKGVEATQANVRHIWLLRTLCDQLLQKGRDVGALLAKGRRRADDALLRLAAVATIAPEFVTLQAPFFDLGPLADAEQEETFRGLYPFVRSVVAYPAGTAADNAVFAGVPGLLLGFLARFLRRFSWLSPILRRLERRTLDRFLKYFTEASTVVPARLSFVGLDGRWQRVSSHALGGPGSGRLYAADLVKKPKGLIGYLLKLPPAIISEGVFGTTRTRVELFDSQGVRVSVMEGGIAEALYTNRTFLAGVGSVPTTTPTSFAGESSLVLIPSILGRGPDGQRTLSLRGIASVGEAIVKGVVARVMHLVGLDPGRWAGEGELVVLPPSHQVPLKEGAEVRLEFAHMDGRPRAVPVQISGDPYQARRLRMRVFWGPVPMLAADESLLLASARRTLRHLRLEASFDLKPAYIGGVHYFRHSTGVLRRNEIEPKTGMQTPPLYLPRDMGRAGRRIAERWQELGAGEFVDTSQPGLALRKDEVRLHNNTQSAHILILPESRGRLLVRLVRRTPESGDVLEARIRYRSSWGAWVINDSQLLEWHSDEAARIVYEEHFFRDAQQFQGTASSFFPVVSTTPGRPTLSKPWELEGQ